MALRYYPQWSLTQALRHQMSKTNLNGSANFLNPMRNTRAASASPKADVAEQKSQEKVKNFEVRMRSPGFKPEELNVSVVDGDLVIIGNHEERNENGTFIAHSFMRRLSIPRNVNLYSMNCKLDGKGFLSITAPLITDENPSIIIPIHHEAVAIKNQEESVHCEIQKKNE